MPASDHHALVMKSTVPVGTGASIKRVFAEQGKAGFRYVSCPEFLKEGSAVKDFLQPGPRRRRRRRRLGGRRGRRPVRAARRAARAHGHLLGGDGEARVQRVPGHEDLLHQRDRQRLRGDGRGRARGRPRHGARRPHRAEVPAGRASASAARASRRTSRRSSSSRATPATTSSCSTRSSRSTSCRSVASSRSSRSTSARSSASASRCSASRSSPTPTTCARRPRSSSAPACRPTAPRSARSTRSRRPRRGGSSRASQFADDALDAVDGRGRRRARHRVAASSRSSTGREVAARMRGTLVVDGRNALDADAVQRGRTPRTRASGAAPWHPWPSREDPSMQAVILVGGEGTRLRPLTSTVPKPVVPLVDRPFIVYMLEWLRRHGVDDVILSCGFLATSVRNVLGRRLGLRPAASASSRSPTPRGTAGALKYAEELLEERFLMLNGDVLTDIDLTAQIEQHERTGATGTLALVPVTDPSAYGLVRLNDDASVQGVPREAAGRPDRHEPHLRRRVRPRAQRARPRPARQAGLDRARGLAAARRATASSASPRTPTGSTSGPRSAICRARSTSSRATWRRRWQSDWATGFLAVSEDAVDRRSRRAARRRRARRAHRPGRARRQPRRARATASASAAGTTVERSVVLQGAEIGADCVLRDCIVGPGVRIGDRTQVTNGAVLGEGVTIGAENVVTRGARVFPGVELPDGALRF